MDLLSVVGSDPAPVAWGAKIFLNRFPPKQEIPRVYLLESRSTRPMPRDGLVRWLVQSGFRVEWLGWEELDRLKDPLVLNLTAGTKEELFQLLQVSKKVDAQAFVLDAHTSPPLLAWLDARMEPLDEGDFLSLEDYRALYLEVQKAVIRGKASRVPSSLKGPTWYRVALGDDEVLFAVHLGRPYVFKPPRSKVEFKDHLHILARQARNLGGQLVKAFSSLPEGRPQNPNDLATLRQQAKEAGVELILEEDGRASGAELDGRTRDVSPFPLPQQGPVSPGKPRRKSLASGGARVQDAHAGMASGPGNRIQEGG